MRSREEILERIDIISETAEMFRRGAIDPTLPKQYQMAYFNESEIHSARAKELRWALGEEADTMV